MRAFLLMFAVFAAVFFSTEAASGQETNRYTKVANELVELINAGDYAGIQTNFNKEMDAALPLDKSSEFFKGLTEQVGKIQKLGKPQPVGEAMVFPAEFDKDRLDMQITLELPEDIAQGLGSRWKDLPRVALESLALEAYRSHALTAAQLRRLLGFETRMQVDAFLKEHEVYDFTAADFEQDRETLRQLRAREAQH